MAGRFSVESVFKAVDRVTAPVSRMQNRVGKFTRSMERGFNKANRAMARISSGIKRGAVVVAAAMVITSGAMASVISTGAGFEQAITNVGAVSLKTRDQIGALEEQALQLGRTTKFTSTQAANAMEIMAKAGFKQQEILKATPAVLSAAAASGLEIAEVADHVSNVLKGMGLEANEAARVADVLALASARTNSSIGSLGESMKNVASTARQLGVPLEEVVASVALLQDVGLDASVAGSAMNTMLTKMAAPSAAMQKKMKNLGITFKDVKGNMLPLAKVLDQLNVASEKVGGNFDQVAFFAELVGLRGQKAAANLADLFEKGKVSKLTEELKGAAGAADKMARLRMDTVYGSWLLLGSAVDAVKVKIFGLNGGPLKDLIDGWTKWVNANEDLIASKVGAFLGSILTNAREIAIVFLDVAKALVVFFAISAALKLAAAAMLAFKILVVTTKVVVGLLKGAMIAYVATMAGLPKVIALAKGAMLALNLAFTANPVGLVITAIAALIAIAALVFTAWDPVKAFFIDLWDTISSVVGNIMGAFGAVSGFLGLDVPEGRANIPANWERLQGTPGGFGETTPQMISPSERTAKNIEERRETSTAEVTIKDETGRAEVTKGNMGGGITLEPSGAF